MYITKGARNKYTRKNIHTHTRIYGDGTIVIVDKKYIILVCKNTCNWGKNILTFCATLKNRDKKKNY